MCHPPGFSTRFWGSIQVLRLAQQAVYQLSLSSEAEAYWFLFLLIMDSVELRSSADCAFETMFLTQSPQCWD